MKRRYSSRFHASKYSRTFGYFGSLVKGCLYLSFNSLYSRRL